ncbi:MAG TPA: hypothetical protein VJB94_02315 [Candidatus Nanoarchaeia archaeon]|nr:hypothetical protein [Candidatus Nanoarchaeia archaeon]
MPRTTKCMKIDAYLWKKVKLKCVKEDLEISQYLEDLIKKDLKRIN